MKKIQSYILFGIYIILFFLVWYVLAIQSSSHPFDAFPYDYYQFRPDFNAFLFFSTFFVLIAHLLTIYFYFRFQIKLAIISGLIETILIIIQFLVLSFVNFNILTLHNFIAYYPFGILIMIIIAGIQIYLILIKSREKMVNLSKKAQRERLAKTIIDKERVDIVELVKLLKVSQKTFERQLLDWAVEFSLKIDGDDILINIDTQNDFLDALDAKYVKWQENIEKKTGKKI
jgi:hypothetical protein